jgi:hypothetical protein
MTSLTCGGRIMFQSTKQRTTTIQEDVMNKKQMILAAMMLFAATNLSYAQFFFPVLGKYTPAEKERMDKLFAISLNSGNRGVVESALAIATMIKMDLPTDELPMIRAKIENLSNSSRVPAIRYKACFAKAVFANPAKFKQEVVRQYNDSDEFFSAMDGTFNQTMLSSK